MKNKFKIKKILSCLIPIALITFGFVYFGMYILPGQLADSAINGFENAFYERKPENSFKFVYKESYLSERLKENINDATDIFLKFERGYKINHSSWASGKGLYGSTEDRITIWVYLSKIAKIDGIERDYFEVALLRDEGEWKIFQYAFPDVINY